MPKCFDGFSGWALHAPVTPAKNIKKLAEAGGKFSMQTTIVRSEGWNPTSNDVVNFCEFARDAVYSLRPFAPTPRFESPKLMTLFE